MIIKHIVIPGGGSNGICSLGALKYLETQNYWKLQNLETFYATSVGTYISTFISMGFEWDMVTDYIIKRPWQEAIQIKPNMFFDAYSKKGLFDRKFIEIIFEPFFKMKEWSLDITMLEFYNETKKELHFFTLDINEFKIHDVSYKTYPDLPILTAIQMSSAIPGLISPVFLNGKCFVDGGVLCNYPLKICMENANSTDEIFAINNYCSKFNEVKEDSTILEYIISFITNLILYVGTQFIPKPNSIENELIFETNPMTLSTLKNALYSQNIREELYDLGVDKAKIYLEKMNKSIIQDNELTNILENSI
jgi:predicted acylesterase/phospholipase RssA